MLRGKQANTQQYPLWGAWDSCKHRNPSASPMLAEAAISNEWNNHLLDRLGLYCAANSLQVHTTSEHLAQGRHRLQPLPGGSCIQFPCARCNVQAVTKITSTLLLKEERNWIVSENASAGQEGMSAGQPWLQPAPAEHHMRGFTSRWLQIQTCPCHSPVKLPTLNTAIYHRHWQ